MSRWRLQSAIIAVVCGAFACDQKRITGTDLGDGGEKPCEDAGGRCLTGTAIVCDGTIQLDYDCSEAESPAAICCLATGAPDSGVDAGPDAGPGAGKDAGPKPLVCVPGQDSGTCTPGRSSALSLIATYPAANFAQLVSVDLDGDGMLDLVGVGSFQMEVYFGRTDGGLSQPTVYPLSGVGELVAVGDLNGDGRPDVVVVDGILKIYINDGSGGLLQKASVTPTAATAVTSIAIGDLNADGFPDLVVGEQVFNRTGVENAVDVYFGGPGGSFSSPMAFPELGGMSSSEQQVLVADLNADGLADLVADVDDPSQMYAPPQLAVLLNQGDGGFLHTSYAVPFTAFTLLPQRDRVPDLLLTNGNPDAFSYIQVMENTCADSFQLGRAYSIGGTSTAIGDFNGDCEPDIAASMWTSSEAAVSVIYGDGKGGFTDPQALAQVPRGPSGLAPLGPVDSPRALAVGDFYGGPLTVYGDASR